jgi:hypothetical protein
LLLLRLATLLHSPWCLFNYSITSESICNCSKLNFAGETLSTVPVNYLILRAICTLQ